MELERRYIRQLIESYEQKQDYKKFILKHKFLQDVPREMRTPEVCKLAVQIFSLNLKYVPDEFKTPELCKLAVKDKGYNLAYVPDKLKTYELCKIAVTDNGVNIQKVPNKFKTVELCKIAMETFYDAFLFIPYEIKKKMGV